MARLTFDQSLRCRRAIANKIGGEILSNLGGDRSGPIADAVDDDIGQARQRHFRRIDDVALRVPFRRYRLGQGERRRGKDAAGRRAHRLVVEPHGKALASGRCAGLAVEAAPQDRPRGAAHRLHGMLGRGFLERVAHRP